MKLANTKFPNICKYFRTFFAYCATKAKKMQKKKENEWWEGNVTRFFANVDQSVDNDLSTTKNESQYM